MRALIIAASLSWVDAAFAHGGQDGEPSWTFDPWIVVPLLAGLLVYGLGYYRLSVRAGQGRKQLQRHGLFYVAGWLTLAGALVSPLHWLGEHLFAFHMVEHEIVMAISAPLIVLSRPSAVYMWAFAERTRMRIASVMTARLTRKGWSIVTGGAVSTTLHGAAIWVWHVPALFDASVENVTIHRLQHVSFFVTAILFWWSVLWVSARGAAAWHLFITMMHTSILGALMALAPHVLYGAQTADAARWGLTPLEDQQLAGMLMWVPAGTVYAGGALAMLALLISRSGRKVNA
jgi:putative membrane protein